MKSILKIKVSEGKRRLRILVVALVVIFSYISIYRNTWRIDEFDMFIVMPILAVLCGLIGYLAINCIYWVIEGFESKAKNDEQVLFDICLSGSEILLNEKSDFKNLSVEDNELLSKMKGDLTASFEIASISYSFSLVCCSALKIDIDFFSSDTGEDFTKLVMSKLVHIDSASFDESLDDEKLILRSKKSINEAIEAAKHMQKSPHNQFSKLLEALATLYCSKIFENEVKKIGKIIKISRNLIKTNEKLVKNSLTKPSI